MAKVYNLPKYNIAVIRKILVVVIIIAFSFTGGYFLGNQDFDSKYLNIREVEVVNQTPTDKETLDFGLFWRVWDTLATDYVDETKLNAQEMVYGAVRGMVAAVGDPYTVFLAPSENKVVQEDLKGSFEGVGIQIGFKGSRLAVIAPLPGTPAEEAGIKAGDYIIGIKDEEKDIDRGTIGISLPDAVQAIRGPAGSTVTLALTREGKDEPIIVDVKRKSIEVPSVSISYVGENDEIAHVKLLKFVGETNGDWEDIIKEILTNKNIKGVVLDLRNNPGGYLQGSVDIAGEFLENGTLVVVEEYANGKRNEFKTDKFPRLDNTKVVILVNEGSASASEILAAALSEKKGLTIIGTKTFGKGTIQEPRQLDDGAALHITTAKWLTSEGKWINDEGLMPDVEIEDDLETDEDEQLDEAIKALE
ncbi:S41 family peptidase [Patescibacteria group bacterium]